MRLFPRSKKKRIVKKWFKRTGYIRGTYYIKQDGIYFYKVLIPIGCIIAGMDLR